MNTNTKQDNKTIEFLLNNNKIQAFIGETIIQAARRNKVEIPHLCYKDNMRADGNCRACVVEIKGERTLQPACVRMPTDGMVVNTDNERALHSQKMVLELLGSDVSKKQYTKDNELEQWTQKLELKKFRFKSRNNPQADLSHPAIAVNLDACIQCGRCVRACREEQNNDVIGYAHRGANAEIVFDIEDNMGDSSCVACGECVQACPTGALMPANNVGMLEVERKVNSACPYCGVGCLLTFNVKDDKIIHVEGRDGPANKSRLCVKGRYGFDYIHNKERLTKPLMRKPNAAKVTNIEDLTQEQVDDMFYEVSWDEALDFAAGKFKNILDNSPANSLAGFGSAKGSNEEAYLFQKLIRTGFKTNNVDHCTRLCHASSVVALLEGIGSGAVSNQVEEVKDAEVIVIIGSNTTTNHPVAATFIKNAKAQGKILIVMDPRRTEIARHADYFLQFKPDTDVAMLNAIMHSIIKQGLTDKEFIDKRTEGYKQLEQHLQDFAPEEMQKICGIAAETIDEVAKIYASSKASIIFWGMGISQHIHGTDNARCLISLSLITGQIGKPGAGLHPLRGQNNVQGASDVGLIPMMLPDYQRVDNKKAQQRFEELWKTEIDSKPGLTVVEIMHAINAGTIKGMYVEGENPAMSDPNLNHARKALASLEHLVVQDIFMTETAMFADVILPAAAFAEKDGTFTNTDRRVQLGRKAVPAPGDARQDWWIIKQIANRLGLDWNYQHPRDIFAEMRLCMDSIKGISWQRLEQTDSVTYPCVDENDPGQGIIFIDKFPTVSGRAKIVPASFINADELPDKEYSFVLITGRQLEHWHTGSMTRRASVLDAIEPVPVAMINPLDMQKLNIQPNTMVRISSRRGSLECFVREDNGLAESQVFMPFCYHEAAANLLTNDALDPYAKIPEFKFCAIKLAPV